ncbi:hypothetical protein [Paenibacillus hamazuiensis]|uniref:hypothetical protein n=1 Tax=Paenibacillus hamazuiensis TaxID=2936508 RepID=UPI00200FEF5D|nr:hypothetical protein [Paenibacillus hamazuiensis]
MHRRSLILSLCFALAAQLHAGLLETPAIAAAGEQVDRVEQTESGTYETQGYRSGRSTYSPSRGGTTTAPRTGAGYTTGPRNPNTVGTGNPRNTAPGGAAATPARTGFGGFFGGLAAGTLLGSLFHPFGWFGGGGYGYPVNTGFSLLGIAFWAVVIYFVYRWVRRKMKGNY